MFTSRSLLLLTVVVGASAVMVRDKAPDFTATTVSNGEFVDITLSDYTKSGKWVVLFFYPFDFTFICPTEILTFSKLTKEFAEKNTQILGVSADSHHVHMAWSKTKREDGGLGEEVEYPLVADTTSEISIKYGVLTNDTSVGYHGAPLRATFIIDPTGTIRYMNVFDEQVGRNIDEVMRAIDAFQYAETHAGEGCPANWEKGKSTIKTDHDGKLEYLKVFKP